MKNSVTGIPSIASLFSAYASLSAFITLLQQAFNQFIPQRVRDYIIEKLEEWFNKSRSSPCLFTLVIEESDSDSEGYNSHNQVFEACEKYLSTKLSNFANRLKVSRHKAEDSLNFKLAQGEQFKESFEGKDIVWSYIISSNENSRQQEKRHFEMVIEEKYKEVLKSYLDFVLDFYEGMMERKKDLNLYTLGLYYDWHSVEFKHPFTFNSLAMDPEVKKSIIDDLDRFVKRKEFYKRVGKAWKRGYLLHGPPGTGKSSLIAAMANYLKFDIYDLQLDRVENDSNLRHLMLNTSNKSILVLEDIDCSFGLPSCRDSKDDPNNSENKAGDELQTTSKISLSGLLNFVDGLWSSCGDERIIIFTTNHKDKLDPALLRPGRMDIHIHMSYLTMPGFRVLASNYLQTLLHDEHEHEYEHEHPLFGEIESLIKDANVTAAEISEEMLRSDDNVEAALRRVVQLLKMKKSKIKEVKEKLVTLYDNDMNLGVEKRGELRKIEE